ncbi:MAG TPA: type 1 glutamine amidotransferase domain-containing protein [Acidimicrobiia bacterium]|jgi:protease I
MAGALEGRRIAFLVANEGVEQAELTESWKAVEGAGGAPELIATEMGEVQAFRHLDRADRFTVDRSTADAEAERYDGLVLPGGVANADTIRTDRDAVRFVGEVIDARLPIAVICHGPWILTEVDALHGRTLTSWPSLQTDLRNAGAHWVDEEVHVEPGLVSSRKPDDLPAFCSALVEEFRVGPRPSRPEAGSPLAV